MSGEAEREAIRFLLALASASLPRLARYCVTLEVGGTDMRISEIDATLGDLSRRLDEEATLCLR